jgi:dTDP-4-dehydrorhamnose 3,5-epimerase
MKIISTYINGVIIFEPNVHKDTRGFFLESWNKSIFNNLTNLDVEFVQDNLSRSSKHVIRGLHYQLLKPQGKFVKVINGEILDVIVDLRKSSPTFGKYLAVKLSSENFKQIWVPPGCAHGFLVLSEFADVIYKVSEYYLSKDEQCIIWNDPELNIDWQLKDIKPKLSLKDLNGKFLKQAELYEQ